MGMPILEHLENLRKRAEKENKDLHDDFKTYKSYYKGKDSNKRGYFNIIKGIVDAKTSLVLDNDIVSAVIPSSKSFSDIAQINQLSDIASILEDCNKSVQKNNNYDKVKTDVVKNLNIYGRAYCETTWEQEKDNQLGDVKITVLNPATVYVDKTAKTIKDANYILIKEIYSSITLKKQYPHFIEKFDEASGVSREDENKTKQSKNVVTVGNEINTTQMYTGKGSNNDNLQTAKNIAVWKCYLKDDSTFLDSKDEEKQMLALQYPNGRLLKWVEGADDYILEDKPVDYPFGFPVDMISGDSVVEGLIEIQNRINRSFEKIRYLIGGYVSFLAVTPSCDVEVQQIINDLLIKVQNLNQMQVITNNTLDQIKTLTEWIIFLKEQAFEIARLNPALVSGTKETGVNSGKMVEQLNESPMATIREVQRLFKDFIISQGKKNISLIQLYYSVPRIIRLSGEQLALINSNQQFDENGNLIPQSSKIVIFAQNEQKKQYEAIREIKGDLSIGDYDIEVIAGTEMPRSKAQRANIMLELQQRGVIPNNKQGNDLLLDALDVPNKSAILEAQDAMMQEQPQITLPFELAGKIFKDMPIEYQAEFLAQFGFNGGNVNQPVNTLPITQMEYENNGGNFNG